MITFKNLLETVYAPSDERELIFLLKHIIKKYDYPADTENQFTANYMEKDRSKAASYHDGEDEEVYEEIIHEDKVKTNRIDRKSTIVHSVDPKTGESKVFVRNYSTGEIDVGKGINENFKPGHLTLHDGHSVILSSDDSIKLNSLFVTLNDSNQSKMDKKLMSNIKGFTEILNFAKEAI